ncbi:MAG: protein-L-isoaspartate(D-aspartate) O-methyltransferase [Candidatus Aenigmarchaeota archaeon]|nr:protein-L-isoaspartate(D-aspartate) O-methyltransferase [Candidatus Aenigmarchaeota archaeon]
MIKNSAKTQLIKNLEFSGYIKSPKIKKAMLKVPRELFVPEKCYDEAYSDTPLPIPGDQTISAPHMHTITLSELKLKEGDKVLEVGSGSGILLAYIREIVGATGKVVGIEINKETYKFAKENLKRASCRDVILIHGDGSSGYSKYAPYDKVVVSAASPDIPKPIIEQLRPGGILLIVIGSSYGDQNLIKVRKTKSGRIIENQLMPVVFVPLKGKYGYK